MSPDSGSNAMIDERVKQTTTAKILPYILRELEKLGYDKEAVFVGAGLEYILLDNHAAASGRDCSTLFNYACCLLAAETGHPNQRTFVTKQVTDILLHTVITCEDLAEVIERASVYGNLIGSAGIGLRLTQKGQTAELSIDINRSQLDIPSLLLTMASMSIFYQLFCWITATRLQLTEVSLRYGRPEFPIPLGALQGQPIAYNQDSDRFVFPTTYLSLPVVRDATQLKQVIDYFPVSLSANPSDDTSISARIQAIVQTSLSDGLPPMRLETAAQLANLSPATLRRKLRSEDTSFSQIVDQCRYAEAERSLKHTNTAIKTIAFQLGFSDDRAFRRAFKRWSGHTPTDIREQSLNSGNSL